MVDVYSHQMAAVKVVHAFEGADGVQLREVVQAQKKEKL